METSLENIIKGCRQYNKFAQKLLFEKYASEMNGICLRYISNSDIIKDIVQEGFIKVFAKIRQYSGKGSFDGWIKRIFINTTITYIRQYSKEKHIVNIEELKDEIVAEENEYYICNDTDTKYAGNQMLSKAEFSEIELLEVLKELPEKYRLVFNLFCIEGLKHEEIAKLLDIDTSTSRTRLMRARHIIQKKLYALSLKKMKQRCTNDPINRKKTHFELFRT